MQKFVELISDKGPLPDYMRFFSDTVSCNGQPVESNQEAVLHSLWMQEETRRQFLLANRTFTDAELSGHCQHGVRMDIIPELSAWAEPTDRCGRDNLPGRSTLKPLFMGQQLVDGDGFPLLWASWASPGGANAWRIGQAGALFHSAASLGMGMGGGPAGAGAQSHIFTDQGGAEWVPLSTLLVRPDPAARCSQRHRVR